MTLDKKMITIIAVSALIGGIVGGGIGGAIGSFSGGHARGWRESGRKDTQRMMGWNNNRNYGNINQSEVNTPQGIQINNTTQPVTASTTK